VETMLEFLAGRGRVDLEAGAGFEVPHGGRCCNDFGCATGPAGGSLFQRFESAVADPFLRVLRKEPFLSTGFDDGLSDLSFLVAGEFVPDKFLGGGLSEPLMDEAELIGFRDLF